MGINIRNNIRKVDAKLVNATIDKYGASYPAQSPWRADGFNKVFVETEGANPTQKDFLEGNSSVLIYAIGSNIGSLLPYSLASFTNIKELYLFSPTMVNIGAIDNDYLTYLTDSDLKVYVPSNILQNYINAYGGTGKHLENRFDEITDGYPLTVSGSGDLTSKELTNQLMNKYESVDRTNCTKLIIQGFTNASSVIWGYDFSEILPNLESILVNGVRFDFSVLNIVGSGTLTEVDIDNAISDIAISNRGGVLEVKISGYSDMSVALEYDYKDLPNLEYVWLDNVRYEIIKAPTGYETIEYVGGAIISLERPITEKFLLDFKLLAISDISWTPSLGYYSTQSFFEDKTVFFGNPTRKWFYTNGINNGAGISYAFNGLQTRFNYESGNTYLYSQGLTKIQGNDVLSYNSNYKYLRFNSNTQIYNLVVNKGSESYYVPVKRLSDNRYGLYDVVKNVFVSPNNLVGGNKTIHFNIIPTYFYPLSNLEQEYNANLNQTFYLDYNGTLPTSAFYSLTWYSDESCTQTISQQDMVVGTRYYAKAIEQVASNVAKVSGLGSENPSNVSFQVGTDFQDLLDDLNDGTNDVTDLNNNVFVEIPTIYRKVLKVVDNQITDFAVSTSQIDSTWLPYSCFVKPNGIDIMPYVRIGKYCMSSTTTANSVNATPVNNTIGNARTLAQALGTGYQLYDWQMHRLFEDLSMIMKRSVNVGQNPLLGIYHLDRYNWVDGVARNSMQYLFAYNPSKYINSPYYTNENDKTDGYTQVNYNAPSISDKTIKKLGYETDNQFFNFPNELTSENAYNTYYCDGYYYTNGNHPVSCFVGSSGAAGIFFFYANNNWNNTDAVRLCYRPIGE